MLAKQRRTLLPNQLFQLKSPYEGFHEYYCEVQDHLEMITGIDEMMSEYFISDQYLRNVCIYSGWVSKSQGQVYSSACTI